MRAISRIGFFFLVYPVAVLAQTAPPAQDPVPVQSPLPATDPAPSTGSGEQQLLAPTPVRGMLLLKPQSRPPAPAGNAPEINVSAGYSVANFAMPGSNGVALSGADVSISARSDARFGAKLDIAYSRAPNVLKSGHGADALSYLAGPMFFLSNGNLLTTYVDALFGGARVAGPIPNGTGGFNGAHVQYPAWAFGGGVEYRLSPTFAFRVSVDYLHTYFYNSSQAIHGQNDLRIVNSIVYYWGTPTLKHPRRPTGFHFPLRRPHP